jgi:histidine triad (HIT) family protein
MMKLLYEVIGMEDNCIFCKIIAGQIPAANVYEDDHVLAFLDISQVTEGHTLVIPKKHVENIFTCTDDVANTIFQSVPKIARALQETFPLKGLNVLNNNQPLAGQSVFHYHLHLLPRYGTDDGFGVHWTPQSYVEGLDALAAQIRSNVK